MNPGVKKRASHVFIFILLLSLLASELAFAVTMRPGFKLGGGVSNNFGQDTYQQQWQASLQAGVFVESFIWNHLAAAAELNFIRKGSAYRLDSDGLEYREKYLFDYLELSIPVKYYFASSGRLQFYAYAGPSIALNLKARIRVTFDGLEETVTVNNLQGADFLLNGGAGAAMILGPGSLILEVRYSHGLKSVATEPGGDIRNKSLLLLAGFRF